MDKTSGVVIFRFFKVYVLYTSAGVCFVTPSVPTREEFGGRWPWTAT